MRSLKLIGVLLDYPADTLWLHRAELLDACTDATLPLSRRAPLAGLVSELLELDPMQAQERWLGLFDRGRAMSLLLFEHIHGESRDRGQAMVDLIESYRSNGYELASKELPDYLPLVLEYLSRRPQDEIRDWLHHIGHILELLAARCAERGSPYALLFETLVEIGQRQVDLGTLRQRVANERRDDTVEAMDQVWEEEAVRFGNEAPSSDCAAPGRGPGVAAAMDGANPPPPGVQLKTRPAARVLP
jgi:nitrate reductase delta subunit